MESQGLRWVDAHWATPTSGTGRSGIRIIAIRSPGSKLTALSRAACGFALSLVLLVLLSEGENVESILNKSVDDAATAFPSFAPDREIATTFCTPAVIMAAPAAQTE